MNKKLKGSWLSRISSFNGLFGFCTAAVWFVSGMGNAAMIILGMICGILTPLLAIAGIVFGIAALSRLTPEEKLEKISKSGTTKNNALAGIIASLFVLAVFIFILIISNKF